MKKSKQWTQFKSFQRKCKRAFKEAEVNHIYDVINEGLQIKIASRFGGMINQGNRTIFSESKDKAQILVEQFRSVFTIEDSSEMPHMVKQYRYKLPDLFIKTVGVETFLKNIVTAKACGPDNIPILF